MRRKITDFKKELLWDLPVGASKCHSDKDGIDTDFLVKLQ